MNGTLDSTQIYGPSTTMMEAVTQHHANFVAHSDGTLLKPKRDAKPHKVKAKIEAMKLPTGFFKVIFRPALDGESAHAIGFLLPHTFENLNDIPNVPTKQAFWAFVAQIELIEQVSGIRFPGISAGMKASWGDSFFKRTGHEIPKNPDDCPARTAQAVVENTTKDQRIAMCIDKLN